MLKNKVAVITGGSRGIGRAVALEMAKEGADIAVIYSGSSEKAEAVCIEAIQMGVKAFSYKCDVSDFATTENIIKQIYVDLGRIDILVNNAGITKDGLIMQMTEQDFDNVLAVNLKGAFNMIRHTTRQFAKQKSGRIINISSVSGLMGNSGQANYSASKAGLIGLTKTVAKELASRGVTCNAIAPGFIATDMTEKMPDAVKEASLNLIPQKKMGKPDDIASLAVFLASDKASYITGEVIKVDGGLYI
ncbi:MAG: 3-oxoacyl-[acyl-carrier-protein] reductase [Clostridiales bacterium GWF2_36_10]|nr:MAG: 3-oxoacyl-[acyl-carrier-protein] reductase [Clostridiales bacterium GWF2_36_10]HAN21077.1 beta-ketoacyl-ACP reductase [Clostridiales bacterium]